MACFHPIDAWQSRWKKDNGKSSVLFSVPSNPLNFEAIKVGCGQCVGCRLERSKKWAMRCVHEASLYEDNCFITLTYNDEHLPDDGSLNIRHFQKFMKRLRKKFSGSTIRFFHCGEYGDRYGRPHYHACLFNFDFPDKEIFKVTPSGEKLYTSQILSDLWPFGFSTVGSLTFASAAYVARYIMKKVNGDLADDHYFDPSTGVYLQPEYITMSRRPGIGHSWYKKFETDVFPSDSVIVNGAECKPPRYYDTLYEISNPEGFEFIKNARKAAALLNVDNSTPDRLHHREIVAKARLQTLKRDGVD